MKILGLILFVTTISAHAQHDPGAVWPLADVASRAGNEEARFDLQNLQTSAGRDCDDSSSPANQQPVVTISRQEMQSGRIIVPDNAKKLPNGTVETTGPVFVLDSQQDAESLRRVRSGQELPKDGELNYSVIDPRLSTHSEVRLKGTGVRYQEDFRLGDRDARFRLDVRHDRVSASFSLTLGHDRSQD